MKNIFIIIIFTLLVVSNVNAQTETEENAIPSDYTPAPPIDTSIKEKTLIIGFNLSAGLSLPLLKILPGSKMSVEPSGAFSGNFMFFFNKNYGIMFDLGVLYYRIKEESPTLEIRYEFIEVFFSAVPFWKYKKFYTYLGPYIGILLFGRTKTTSWTLKSTQPFKTLDLGMNFGVGFILGKPSGTLYNLAIDIKFQLNKFKKNNIDTSKTFALYLKFGIMFSSNYALR